MKPKYKVGQTVVMGKSPTYEIKEIASHGDGTCDCCPKASKYFMYRITRAYWVAEYLLERPTIN